MRTATIEVFKFSELGEDAQQRVIDGIRKHNTDYDWYDFIHDDWMLTLEYMGFEQPKISFSGFWSQGDGASFTCSNIDFHSIMDYALKCEGHGWETAKHFFRCSSAYELGLLSGKVVSRDSMYVHEKTISVFLGENFHVPMTGGNNLEKAVNYIEDWLSDIIVDISQKIYRDLGTEYDWLNSNECIRQDIEENEDENEYTKEGVIWDGY